MSSIITLLIALLVLTFSILSLCGVFGPQSPGWILTHAAMIAMNAFTAILSIITLSRRT